MRRDGRWQHDTETDLRCTQLCLVKLVRAEAGHDFQTADAHAVSSQQRNASRVNARNTTTAQLHHQSEQTGPEPVTKNVR